MSKIDGRFAMLVTAHFFSGVAIFALLSGFHIVPWHLTWLSLIILCSIIPDFDVVICKMHRSKFTHTPFFWACVLIVIVLGTTWSMWIITIPIFFHLFLDTLDYGLMILYPFSRKKHGVAVLGKETSSEIKPMLSYWTAYLSNRRLVCAELVTGLASLTLLISVAAY